MVFRITLIVLLMLWWLPLFAQNEKSVSKANIAENLEIESLLDSIEQQDTINDVFPADELYKNLWNCTNIKYPKTEFARKNDTIVFTLVEPNDNPYCHPFKGKMISKYGLRSGRMHTGTDVKLHLGDSVLCAFDGKVRLVKRFSGYGNLVLVRHNNGIETLYAHLKTMSVKVNENLKAGDLIGLGGRTGRATTEHLHFETRFFGDPFDPNQLIDFANFTLRSNHIYYKNKKISIDIDKLNSDPIKVPVQQLAKKVDNINLKNGNSSSPNSTQTNNEEAIQHIVRRGDNLWSIAKTYNTTIKKICEANQIGVNQILKIGTILFIQ